MTQFSFSKLKNCFIGGQLMKAVLLAFNLLGGLAVFLLGIKMMSEGLQKVAGDKLRKILASATTNRFAGVLSGFTVTSMIQSSSATTVMVVGFVSAGLLTLSQSLGVVFGANIGTTVKAWIVSLLGFKVNIALFALPIIGIGFFSQFITKWKMPHRFGEAMVGFGLLFLGLSIIKNTIPVASGSEEMVYWISKFAVVDTISLIKVVLIGTIVTVLLQSSSAVMVITLTAAALGYVNFPTACALVLGENIGTTITANLASIGSTRNAKRTAIGHTLFNVLGVVWVCLLFNPFLKLVDYIVPGDPYNLDAVAFITVLTIHISAFHTIFNVTNTSVMLPFIKQFEKVVLLIKPIIPEEREEREPQLKFLSTPFGSTQELAVGAARKEIDRMATIVSRMLDRTLKAIKTKEQDKFDKIVKSIQRDEKHVDVLEHKINEYIASLTHTSLTSTTNKKVLSLLSMINNLEKIGDSLEKIAVLLSRSREKENRLIEQEYNDIEKIALKAQEFLRHVKHNILHKEEDDSTLLEYAHKKEKELDILRNELRETGTLKMFQRKSSGYSIVMYADMLSSYEQVGDYALNISEAMVGLK